MPISCAVGRLLFPKVSTWICRKIGRCKEKPRLFRAGSEGRRRARRPRSESRVDPSSFSLRSSRIGYRSRRTVAEKVQFSRIDDNYRFACRGEQRARLSLTKPENPSKIGILEFWLPLWGGLPTAPHTHLSTKSVTYRLVPLTDTWAGRETAHNWTRWFEAPPRCNLSLG